VTQNQSNLFGDSCAHKWGARKEVFYKSTRTCKIIFFCTHKVTCICYGP